MATRPVPQPSGQDPVTVDPKHYTIELENERVRVLRVRYGAGEKSVMHGHPTMVGVMLTDARIRFTHPDGTTEEIAGNSGQVMGFPAHEHLPENLSDQPFEAVIIELKG